jgi:Holliday junction resolvase
MANRAKQKGDREERRIVNLIKEWGFHAVRAPLSGAVQFRGQTDDIDAYFNGVDKAPFFIECKMRKDNSGFKVIDDWMGNADILSIRTDGNRAKYVLTEEALKRLVLGV